MKKTTIAYRVPYADTDQMGVVYYANYFVLFERVRSEILRASGRSYREIESDGLIFPVLEAHCEYVRSARYDDLLQAEGWLSAVEGGRFRMDYEIRRDGEVLATGYTWHGVFTIDGKARRVPQHIKAWLH